MSTTDSSAAKRFKASSYTGSHGAQVQAAVNAAAAYAAQSPKPADLLDDSASLYALRNTASANANAMAGPNALQAIAEDDVGGVCDFTINSGPVGPSWIQMKSNVRLEFSKDVKLPANTPKCDLIRTDGAANFTVCAKPGVALFNTARNLGTKQRHPEWTVGKVVIDMRSNVTPGAGNDGKPIPVNCRLCSMGPNITGAKNFRFQNIYVMTDGDCTTPGVKQDQSLFTPRGKLLVNAIQNGVFIDMDFDNTYSGYGAFQNSAAYRCAWLNLREWGGTMDRNESDGHTGGSGSAVFKNYGIAQCDHIALYQEDGNKALTMQPNQADYFNNWYVDGVYGLGNLETANSGQFDGGQAADSDQTFKNSFWGEIWCYTGDHSTWQEEFPCHTNDTAGTWGSSGPLSGNIWASCKYNLGKRGGPGAGVDGTGAAINFASRDPAGKVNGTQDTTMTPATMRARWASKKITLGGTVTPPQVPGKPVLTGPTTLTVEEPYRLTVHGTVNTASDWEWRLTKNGVAGSWVSGAPGMARDVRVYGAQLGVRAIAQHDYPNPGDVTDIEPWIDHLEDDILGRNLDFRNCFGIVNTGAQASAYFKANSTEQSAWNRGEIAYTQLHCRRRIPGQPNNLFSSGTGDVFWDKTAPGIDATLFPVATRKGVMQGDMNAFIDALGTSLKGKVYPTNATTTALGVAGQPVKMMFCFHHEPEDDYAAQGFLDRTTAGAAWAAAFNVWVQRWNAIGIPGVIGYVSNHMNSLYKGTTGTPDEWTGKLNFPVVTGGDAYIDATDTYVTYKVLTTGQYNAALQSGDALHQGELGYDPAVSGGVSMATWMTAMETEILARGNIGWVCFQGNQLPTHPYFDDICLDTATNTAFKAIIAGPAFTGLDAGVYKLEARCTNSAGTGAVSNPFNLTVNGTGGTIPSKATIDSGPLALTTSSSAVFTFSSTNATSLQYKLDGGAFITHTSPLTITSVTPGQHTLVVHGTNTDGTGPDSDTYTWQVVASQTLAALVLSGTSIVDGVGQWSADSAATLPIPIPSTAAVGNLLVLVAAYSGGVDISVPPGWTLINRSTQGTTATSMACYRIYTGTEQPEVTLTAPNTNGGSAFILNFSSVYAATPILSSTIANSG